MFYGRACLPGKCLEEANLISANGLLIENVVYRNGTDDPFLSPQWHARTVMEDISRYDSAMDVTRTRDGRVASQEAAWGYIFSGFPAATMHTKRTPLPEGSFEKTHGTVGWDVHLSDPFVEMGYFRSPFELPYQIGEILPRFYG